MIKIVKIDGWYRAAIDTAGRPNKYGTPKDFRTREAAEQWIKRRTYCGMSYQYQIIDTEEE